ncbi:hypothetical protein [Nostoc punctiforme]|uniref:Uncharacterized protein n=1 Tax=Nostoc punctiforme (strain ATCC 29133 / PCC 73102) TaxID=63737 RepID=B2J1G9_NOSP7|nr:hypothetical protein [Nostoc punctiforme]ACC80330.1 hypothetical protein Npun_R1658 [Nostoc punctiforme PCC 73102]
MADEQKIVVEVPSDRGYSPVASTAQVSRLEEFKKGWRNAIALPDNLADLAFDLTASLTIPALFSSSWVSLPLPSFIRWGVMVMLALSGVIACYLRQAIPEIETILLIRLGLIFVGVLLGL